MSTDAPFVIEESNLSRAWGRAFVEAMERGKRNLRPLIVTIGGFETALPPEVPELRRLLDSMLVAQGKNESDVSALTIFPYKMWVRRGRPPCEAFSKLCMQRLLPRMRKRDHRNQYGTYFERMMAFTGERRGERRIINQLQFVIDQMKKNRRRRESALQIACFDPAKDHTGQPVRGFPCLQQVGIAYDDQGNLAVNALYPVQYIFDRAYGNYLGLCQLGEFIAHQTGGRFVRLTCFIAKPELGNVSKKVLFPLVEAATHVLA